MSAQPPLRPARFVAAAAVSLLAALSTLAPACRRSSHPVPSGALAVLPEFETVDGGRLSLGTEAGNVIVINRWASWCGPCREEVPGLVALLKRHGAEGLRVYGLNDEERDVQVSSARALGITYPLLKDPGSLPKPFEPSGYIPETYLIARDGRLVETILGYHDQAAFAKAIEPLLREKAR